jgi:hypothetical protein
MRDGAAQLKSNQEVTVHAEKFAAEGDTVFAINHRQASRFRYLAPIEDAQRAVLQPWFVPRPILIHSAATGSPLV